MTAGEAPRGDVERLARDLYACHDEALKVLYPHNACPRFDQINTVDRSWWIETARIFQDEHLAPLLAQARAEGAQEAAWAIAREWQCGAWTGLPDRVAPPALPALARGQHVTDWLRDRARQYDTEAGER